MDLTLVEQLHNLGIQMFYAVGAGSPHVPYQKPLHKRMTNPLVGDTVTYVGRSGSSIYEPSLTGVLLRVDSSDTTGPRQATIAPLNEPDQETRARYDSLIALPVVSNHPGAGDGWASLTNPPPVHLLRCVDENAAEEVWAEIDRGGSVYGRNLLFPSDNPAQVADIAAMAAECLWATEAEAAAMLDRHDSRTGETRMADHD